MDDLIRIRRDELFAKGVNDALARDRQLRGRRPEPPPISPFRAFLLSPLFYLTTAGALAALAAWFFIEPHFHDLAHTGGEITLVNRDPFETWDAVDGIILTVGNQVEVVVNERLTRFEAGENGQPAFRSFDDLRPGLWIEAVGQEMRGDRMAAVAIRPSTPDHASPGLEALVWWVDVSLFTLTAVAIAMALLFAEGVASQNWARMVQRALLGGLLTFFFSLGAYFLPARIMMAIGHYIFEKSITPEDGFVVAGTMKGAPFIVLTICRSGAWACIGAALGCGMNLVRATKAQLRNSVVGGALGGALGGMFFDPIDRFTSTESLFGAGGAVSRFVGLVAVGLCVGVFVALAEQLAREAWVRVRTGPLAGKSFVLYRTPTTIGSAPAADIYLFKDVEIGPRHAQIHRVGNRYEIEDLGNAAGVQVGGRAVRRHRLVSGDQIILGATVLEFEERAKKS